MRPEVHDTTSVSGRDIGLSYSAMATLRMMIQPQRKKPHRRRLRNPRHTMMAAMNDAALISVMMAAKTTKNRSCLMMVNVYVWFPCVFRCVRLRCCGIRG